MTFFLLLILTLLFIYVIRPLWRVYSAIKQQQRQAQDFFRGMSGDPDGSYSGNRNNPTNNKQSSRRKIIDPNVGEYIDYEEITTETNPVDISNNDPDSQHVSSARISDAEWEEIK